MIGLPSKPSESLTQKSLYKTLNKSFITAQLYSSLAAERGQAEAEVVGLTLI